MRGCAAIVSALGALASGCASLLNARDEAPPLACAPAATQDTFDYVIVGSGAGGGPLAANLALAGFRVLLLEAGGNEQSLDYEVPAFHARASEDDRMSWNFYVRHYADDAQQRRDPKFLAARGGVLYPRCAALGGCTAHNAMILVYPHNSDWDSIAEITGDASWHSDNMRQYFERLERCEYPAEIGSRHGFKGWLTTNIANPLLVVRDRLLKKLIFGTLVETLADQPEGIELDPNSWRFVARRREGVCMTPLTTDGVRRVGSREYIERARQACPDRLVVRTHAFVTRVVLDDSNRATGVEYRQGEHLYRADPLYRPAAAARPSLARATREVILSAGAFNTPQILMLSGIGPREELERHGIPVRVDRPGVGRNLQDRYEISVVTRMKREFALMSGMKLRPPLPGEAPDAALREWEQGRGPYTTNGAVMSVIKRSREKPADPDLFIFGLLGSFQGYYPGYSAAIAPEQDLFTWAILKAHARNTGRVTLRSADPLDVPDIDFNFFAGAGNDADLDAVIDGVETARKINARCSDVVDEEIVPGRDIQSREQIGRYIKDRAWGHHACCTCKIGRADDTMAVVDGRFRVHGTQGLRVVDASVFPKIPGFFLVAAVYMLSEKARDVIVEDARGHAAVASTKAH